MCGEQCEAQLAERTAKQAKGRGGASNGFAALQGMVEGEDPERDPESDDEAEAQLLDAIEVFKAQHPKAGLSDARDMLESKGYDISLERLKEILR